MLLYCLFFGHTFLFREPLLLVRGMPPAALSRSHFFLPTLRGVVTLLGQRGRS
jgi:hypothetical protein